MGTSKILIDGVGIDLTQDTVAANKMLLGTKAHDSNGDAVTGNIQTWAGQQSSGVKNIAANGTYDVSEFASAVVNVQADNYRRWTYTSTGTASKVSTTLVSGDPWISAHYNDSDLVIAIRPLFVPQPGAGLRSILSAIGSNSPMCYGYRTSGSLIENLYGIYARFAADNGATGGYTRSKKLTELNDVGDIGVDAGGNIMLCTTQGVTYMLQLGDWDITAYLMR